ncbi:MAG: hypothetical protein QOH61_5 [Chloroflexota bacterium]|jgi:MOSC domain-containing protein YiiM/GNAT superfamily N-acetyltransferase|nr:hypothetical protein [Chloroflexota bacterium]
MSTGRVLSVNVSPGGLPKLPIERAWVGRMGVEGDRHNDDTDHGGPLRAVCLFGIEIIERLQSEGHPLVAGSVGENLTTTGIEWSTLPAGTRVRVGERLLLEIVKPAMPCDTQRPNFIRGEFKRISIKLFPSDSRMYARVLEEGDVRAGDAVELLPPAADSDVAIQLLLDRTDEAEQTADVRLWRAAREAGVDIHFIDDGELAVATSPTAPDEPFNHADGLRALPNLLPRVLDQFRAAGRAGWLPMAEAPWTGAVPDHELSVTAAAPEDVADANPPEGVTLRHVDPSDVGAVREIVRAVAAGIGIADDEWAALVGPLLAMRDVHAVAAYLDGEAVACGMLHVHKKVGLLRTGLVVPAARGGGLQRALIGARARLAADLGCDLVAARAQKDSISDRNLQRLGLRRIWECGAYRFDPRADPVPWLTERGDSTRHAHDPATAAEVPFA